MENRLQGQMDYYHKACMQLQAEYRWLSTLNIIATAAVPVFTLAVNDWAFSKYIAAVLGALASVFTSILLLHKTKETQVNYRNTYEDLKTERIFYLNGVEKYRDKNSQECYGLFIETCESLMKREHKKWGELKQD